MLKLITPKYKYTVYHDEENFPFVLLSCMAVYKYAPNKLHVSCWKVDVVDAIVKQKINLNEPWKDDEGSYHITINPEHFPKLLGFNTYTDSAQYKSTWIKNKEIKLGHQIIKHYK